MKFKKIILGIVIFVVIISIIAVYYYNYNKVIPSSNCVYPECIDNFENGG